MGQGAAWRNGPGGVAAPRVGRCGTVSTAIKIRTGLDNQEVPSASLSELTVTGQSRAPSPGFVLIGPDIHAHANQIDLEAPGAPCKRESAKAYSDR